MKGFSVSVNDWGVHAILYKSLSEGDRPAWIAALRDAGDRVCGRPRPAGLFLDLRDASDAALSPAHLEGLAKLLTRGGLGRSAVLLTDPVLARRLAAAGKAADLRILVSDGRDRILITAAYGWILNGTEPRGGREAGRASGDILPFPKAPHRPPASTDSLRQAS
ncbi:hypothetical protein J2847_000693 [Azospirillum agricola]|uniref:hypothetical protein n=1 Tax=Azospirillum agricola TaxID=1720247 RepID=UPI001AE1E2E9|nr:hypothetical protein [Azospirillum agricola]MBP2227413.1 hypothetical protein [Azospirillum agricola]